jgi:RecA/RadA recombinase
LVDAGITNLKTKSRILSIFENTGIDDVTQLYSYSKSNFKALPSVTERLAKQLFTHLQKVKRRGKLVITGKQLKILEYSFNYLQTSSGELNTMLTYSNGLCGLRSKTLVEIYGEPSTGKTQFCMTMAVLALRPQSLGGWGKAVAYIDSEGAFEYSRFRDLARYWSIPEEYIQDRLFVSKADNFDDVEEALSQIAKLIVPHNIGVIIVDSMINPLKTSYPLDAHLTNLQPRQQHLKIVCDRLKSIAQVHNMIALYTNQVRMDIVGKELVPLGGKTLSHASDIRIEMEKESDEVLEKLGIRVGKATVVDCGFLPSLSGKFLISSMGIVDPKDRKKIVEQTDNIRKAGYLCEDYSGKELPKINGGGDLEDLRQKLYNIK